MMSDFDTSGSITNENNGVDIENFGAMMIEDHPNFIKLENESFVVPNHELEEVEEKDDLKSIGSFDVDDTEALNDTDVRNGIDILLFDNDDDETNFSSFSSLSSPQNFFPLKDKVISPTYAKKEARPATATYRDYSEIPDQIVLRDKGNYKTMRGRPQEAFPAKLHKLICEGRAEEGGFSSVISWCKHGRAFRIHNVQLFLENVMPRYFFQTKLTSFQRQLNIYGFRRLTRGVDAGAYCHELFLEGRPELCKGIVRLKGKPEFDPETEPNFYRMKFMSDVMRKEEAIITNTAAESHKTSRAAALTSTDYTCRKTNNSSKQQKRKGMEYASLYRMHGRLSTSSSAVSKSRTSSSVHAADRVVFFNPMNIL